MAYKFKPLKGLTFWARLLMGAQMAGAIVASIGVVGAIVFNKQSDAWSVILAGGIFLFLAMLIPSSIVVLFWVYGASRNAHSLRPSGITSSPGWAVGWWFIPFASLYKPYESIRDIWIASHGRVNGRYPKGSSLIGLWWWGFLISTILLRVGGNLLGNGDESAGAGFLVYLIAIPLSTASTGIFFHLVGQIHKFQLSANTREAEVF